MSSNFEKMQVLTEDRIQIAGKKLSRIEKGGRNMSIDEEDMNSSILGSMVKFSSHQNKPALSRRGTIVMSSGSKLSELNTPTYIPNKKKR